MKLWSLIRCLLPTLAVLGILLAPLAVPATAAAGHGEQAAMTGAAHDMAGMAHDMTGMAKAKAGQADDMPCCPPKAGDMDCGKSPGCCRCAPCFPRAGPLCRAFR